MRPLGQIFKANLTLAGASRRGTAV